MNNNQILEKAIKKAVKNGWKQNVIDIEIMTGDATGYEDSDYWVVNNKEFMIIFSHSFAKAFWGFKLIFFDETMEAEIYWRYHLQQMVLEEEPLQYLEKFL